MNDSELAAHLAEGAGRILLQVRESGMFEGTVEIDVAEIKGRFDGDLLVRGRLIVRRTGRVTGHIRYAELEIERGGQIAGDVQVIAEADAGEDTVTGFTQPTVVEDTAPMDHESDLRA